MVQWIQIDAATYTVQGWARSSGDTIPESTATTLYVEITDDKISQYETMVAKAQADTLTPAVKYVDGNLVPPVDNRLYVDVVADTTTAQVGTSINVVVTALNSDGSTNTSFNNTVYYGLPDGRVFGYTFVNGVSTRSISLTQSGRFRLQSTSEVRFKSPVDILAVE